MKVFLPISDELINFAEDMATRLEDGYDVAAMHGTIGNLVRNAAPNSEITSNQIIDHIETIENHQQNIEGIPFDELLHPEKGEHESELENPPLVTASSSRGTSSNIVSEKENLVQTLTAENVTSDSDQTVDRMARSDQRHDDSNGMKSMPKFVESVGKAPHKSPNVENFNESKTQSSSSLSSKRETPDLLRGEQVAADKGITMQSENQLTMTDPPSVPSPGSLHLEKQTVAVCLEAIPGRDEDFEHVRQKQSFDKSTPPISEEKVGACLENHENRDVSHEATSSEDAKKPSTQQHASPAAAVSQVSTENPDTRRSESVITDHVDKRDALIAIETTQYTNNAHYAIGPSEHSSSGSVLSNQNVSVKRKQGRPRKSVSSTSVMRSACEEAAILRDEGRQTQVSPTQPPPLEKPVHPPADATPRDTSNGDLPISIENTQPVVKQRRPGRPRKKISEPVTETQLCTGSIDGPMVTTGDTKQVVINQKPELAAENTQEVVAMKKRARPRKKNLDPLTETQPCVELNVNSTLSSDNAKQIVMRKKSAQPRKKKKKEDLQELTGGALPPNNDPSIKLEGESSSISDSKITPMAPADNLPSDETSLQNSIGKAATPRSELSIKPKKGRPKLNNSETTSKVSPDEDSVETRNPHEKSRKPRMLKTHGVAKRKPGRPRKQSSAPTAHESQGVEVQNTDSSSGIVEQKYLTESQNVTGSHGVDTPSSIVDTHNTVVSRIARRSRKRASYVDRGSSEEEEEEVKEDIGAKNTEPPTSNPEKPRRKQGRPRKRAKDHDTSVHTAGIASDPMSQSVTVKPKRVRKQHPSDEKTDHANLSNPRGCPRKKPAIGNEDPNRTKRPERPRKSSTADSDRRKNALDLLQLFELLAKTLLQDPYGSTMERCTRAFHKKRPNCTANPNCLFGLGETNQGIWAMASQRSIQKDNPQSILRLDNSHPVGLRNLGATCYVNALLQSMFMSGVVRRHVYSWIPGKIDQDNKFMEELQFVFASLQEGNRKHQDLSRFAKLLELETAIQQDAQEFNSLLLGFIDRIAQRNDCEPLKRMSKLYSGNQAYLTICSNCGTKYSSKSSFLELCIQIKGHKSIVDGLLEYAHVEDLNGDNKYACGKCKSKQSATRKAVLDEIPNRLNIQLMRFVFDMKKFTKKKLKDIIEIPEVLDFSDPLLQPLLSDDMVKRVEKGPTNKFQYRLKSVLHHKGASADIGHYFAEILDDNQSWWSFDDQLVESFPVWKESSSTAYMVVYENIDFYDSFCKEKITVQDIPKPILERVLVDNDALSTLASDYERDMNGLQIEISKRKEDYEAIFSMTIGDNEACCWVDRDWLQKWIIGYFQPVLEADTVDIIDRAESTKSETPIETVDDNPNVLQLFTEPAPKLECQCPTHGSLGLQLANRLSLKRISVAMFDRLQQACAIPQMEPLCDNGSLRCQGCVKHLHEALESHMCHLQLVVDVGEILETWGDIDTDTAAFRVSKAWAKDFRKWCERLTGFIHRVVQKSKAEYDMTQPFKRSRKSKAIKDPSWMEMILDPEMDFAIPEVNSDLICEHGGFCEAKTFTLPVDAWNSLVSALGKSLPSEKIHAFANASEPCSECSRQLAERHQEGRDAMAAKNAQLRCTTFGTVFRQLVNRRQGFPNRKDNVLEPGTYNIVPRAWMSSWRDYMNAKKPTNTLTSDSLQRAIRTYLICDHGNSIVHPRLIQWLHHSGFIEGDALLPMHIRDFDDTENTHVEVLRKQEWEGLLQHYPSAAQCELTLETPLDLSENSVGCGFRVEPELCVECMNVRELCHREESKTFSEGFVDIVVVGSGTRIPGMDASMQDPNTGDTPGSKRQSSRRRTPKKSIKKSLRLSSQNTISELKLLLLQDNIVDSGFNPSAVRLFANGTEILSLDKSLQECGIEKESTVYVVMCEDDEAGDGSEWFSLTNSNKVGNTGGFKGTVLFQ